MVPQSPPANQPRGQGILGPGACFLREGGRVPAGACGRTEFGRLFIDFLWVAEDPRGSGLGSEALVRLERAARAAAQTP